MLTSVRLIFLPEYNGLFQILPYLQLNSLDKENDHQRQTFHVSVELHQYCDVINWIAKPDEEDWQIWTIACCSEHPNVDTLGFPRWQKHCPNLAWVFFLKFCMLGGVSGWNSPLYFGIIKFVSYSYCCWFHGNLRLLLHEFIKCPTQWLTDSG